MFSAKDSLSTGHATVTSSQLDLISQLVTIGINDRTTATANRFAKIFGKTLILQENGRSWHFRIDQVLGESSTDGAVFQATDLDSSATCAIKVLLPFSTSPSNLELSDQASLASRKDNLRCRRFL